MVGIDTRPRKGFTALRTVDQFALCGISPATRLTFEELRKQAIRVSALLHSDFRRTPKVTLPFSSAVAKRLKGWLQEQANSEKEKNRAVRLFYANTTGHRGLTWQPYLKDKNGTLVPRSDPAIWRLAGSTPPPSPPPEKQKRKPESGNDKIPMPNKRPKTESGDSSSQQGSNSSESTDVPKPRKKSAAVRRSEYRQRCNRSGSAGGPIPERERKTWGSNHGAPERDDSSSHPKSDSEREAAEAKPGTHEKKIQKCLRCHTQIREEPNGKDRGDKAPPSSPPPPTSSPHPQAQTAGCSGSINEPVADKRHAPYGSKEYFGGAMRYGKGFDASFVKDFSKAGPLPPYYSPPPSDSAAPDQGKASERKEDGNVPLPERHPVDEHCKESKHEGDADLPSTDRSHPPQRPPRTRYTLETLVDLAHAVGDPTRGRIAIACLPDEQDRVVVMQFHPSYQVRYCVEEFDVHSQTHIHNGNWRPYFTTYKHIISGNHKFLGWFAGATEVELNCFASMLYFMNDDASQINAEGLPDGDRSPSWKSGG